MLHRKSSQIGIFRQYLSSKDLRKQQQNILESKIDKTYFDEYYKNLKFKMGQGDSLIAKQDLQEYEDLTYLEKDQILRAYKKFQSIDPVNVNKYKTATRITCERIRAQTRELRLNPYGDRICHVFNTGGKHGMSFEDFLDMYSAMSEYSNGNIKTHYAFKIYDFDEDGFIGKDDIRQAIDRLVFDEDKHLTKAEINRIIENILRECDNDEDGALCYPEFQQAMNKCPDFMLNFKMYL